MKKPKVQAQASGPDGLSRSIAALIQSEHFFLNCPISEAEALFREHFQNAAELTNASGEIASAIEPVHIELQVTTALRIFRKVIQKRMALAIYESVFEAIDFTGPEIMRLIAPDQFRLIARSKSDVLSRTSEIHARFLDDYPLEMRGPGRLPDAPEEIEKKRKTAAAQVDTLKKLADEAKKSKAPNSEAARQALRRAKKRASGELDKKTGR